VFPHLRHLGYVTTIDEMSFDDVKIVFCGCRVSQTVIAKY
jgi:hypothetical protein